MRKSLAAFAFAVFTLAQPAAAVTFPSLTTIYVVSGVFDDGSADNNGTATIVTCSNVSGQDATIRYLVLNAAGNVAANQSRFVEHGVSIIVGTHGTAAHGEFSLTAGALDGAVVNIESTQSGVFCTAAIVNAAGFAHEGYPLHLVRVNAHPGTVE